MKHDLQDDNLKELKKTTGLHAYTILKITPQKFQFESFV